MPTCFPPTLRHHFHFCILSSFPPSIASPSLHFSLFMNFLTASQILRFQFAPLNSSEYFRMKSDSSLLFCLLAVSLTVSSFALPTTVTPTMMSSLRSTIPTLIVPETSAHPLLSETTRSVGRPMLTPRIVTPVPARSIPPNSFLFSNFQGIFYHNKMYTCRQERLHECRPDEELIISDQSIIPSNLVVDLLDQSSSSLCVSRSFLTDLSFPFSPMTDSRSSFELNI
ncbi:hypothetical protein PMAYCL1PPCAC_17593 [Pristionchus mayeri]|uniref:Uncharacterized protein n=1 Tax=Pristionchus mayeri TaxID=1317129 RepID=A0AAN5I0I1_9BILA|nr:hypothetical protein PMAYCL1PPCAC_17593 [Pristionchus mayeri]